MRIIAIVHCATVVHRDITSIAFTIGRMDRGILIGVTFVQRAAIRLTTMARHRSQKPTVRRVFARIERCGIVVVPRRAIRAGDGR